MKKYFFGLFFLSLPLMAVTITTNTTLNKDIVYDENVTVQGAILNLNGNTMTINGNFATSGYGARLQMKNDYDVLRVDGDVTFEGASTYEDLTKGVIELTGDFYQKGTATTYTPYSLATFNTYENTSANGRYQTNNAYSFFAMGTHKVVFNGITQQIVNFEDTLHSGFQNVEIENEYVFFNQVMYKIDTLFTTPELYDLIYKDSVTLTHVNYVDSSYFYLDIKEGMNLIALPNSTDINSALLSDIFNSGITTVWTFQNNSWNGFSTLAEKIAIFSENNISTIANISAGDGIIVNSLIEQTLLFPRGDNYSIQDLEIIESLSTGWHLVGTNRSISVENIKQLNENIVAIWAYDTTKWSADATEDDFIANINKREISPLTSIPSNRAFWVYIQ